MATAVTTEAGPICTSDGLPVAAVELFETPDARREPAVTQAGLTTTLHVTDGVVYVVADDDEWVLTPGDSATIPAGMAYRRWNAGDDAARWIEIHCRDSSRS